MLWILMLIIKKECFYQKDTTPLAEVLLKKKIWAMRMMWLTSNNPTFSLTQACSLKTPANWMGIFHPAKGTSLAPNSLWISNSGVIFKFVEIFWDMNLKSVTTCKKKSSQALFIKESAFYTILSRNSAGDKTNSIY